MKRILILLTISAALTSCGTLRRTATVKTDATVTERATFEAAASDTTRAEIAGSLRESVSATSTLSEGETVVTEVYDYDTTKPTDSITGTPPLKRHTRQERRRNVQQRDSTTIDRRADTSGSLESGAVVAVSAESSLQEELHEDSSAEETPQGGGWLSRLQTVLATVGATAMLLAIAYAVAKFNRFF